MLVRGPYPAFAPHPGQNFAPAATCAPQEPQNFFAAAGVSAGAAAGAWAGATVTDRPEFTGTLPDCSWSN